MEIIRVRLINSEEDKGCEKAPVKVLKALKGIKSSENGKAIEFEKLKLEEIHVDLEDINEANYLIFENSKEAFEKNFKSFFIGGDHSITYSIVKAFNKMHENPLIIVFDAHADCLEDSGLGFNREWLRELIDEGFNPKKIVLISSRNLDKEEREFIKENEITLIGMDVLQEDLEEICDLVMERARDSDGFYISVDMDCVDPGFALGVNNIEAGGMSSRELIYFLKRLSLLDNFRGADVVEINPSKDINEMSVKLGAKLIAEMI